jgi:tripartite-type tricarboxylate transporter receptor subunit TctC
MSVIRALLAKLLPLLAILFAGTLTAAAQYPERDIEIVVPFNAGGGFDSYVRALAPYLERHLPGDVRVIPRNVAGAGGRRGTTEVYRARPDGYTIGAFNLPGVLIPQLQRQRVGYDLSEITWLATLSSDPYVLAVESASPLQSVSALTERDGPILYGATGPGSTAYVVTTIVNSRLGTPYEIVTGYTGSSDYLVGLLRGDVDAVLVNLAAARPYIESGDIRALAAFGATDVATASAATHALAAAELEALRLVRMIGAPPDLPDDVRTTLERALLAALADPGFADWLASTGNTVSPAGALQTRNMVNAMSDFYTTFAALLN